MNKNCGGMFSEDEFSLFLSFIWYVLFIRAKQIQLNDWGRFSPETNPEEFEKVDYKKIIISYSFNSFKRVEKNSLNLV